MRDFSLAAYAALCQCLLAANYPPLTLADYLAASPRPDHCLLLRHDVDRQPGRALAMARLEASLGLRATYYFRTVGSSYHPPTLEAVAALGHEVGYHYETLAQTGGDMPAAIALYKEELAKLRRYAPVQTASMHGRPFSPWDNRDIWQQVSPAEFGLLGEAYRDIDYSQVLYLNDTGRTWNPHRHNRRDHAGEGPNLASPPDSTCDLMAFIRAEAPPRLCLSVHPERWPSSTLGWIMQAGADLGINLAKRVRQAF